MASDFFEVMDQVIHPDFRINRDEQNLLVLTEEKNSGQEGMGEKVLLKTRGKVFAFSLDQGSNVFPFFKNDTPGITKRNDAILFCQDGEKYYVLIIELKSGYPEKGILQLKSGAIFVEYLLKTIDLHFSDKLPKMSPFEFRYIIFHTRKSKQKAPTKRQKKVLKPLGGLDVFLEDSNKTHAISDFFD